jgi:hypothetical protein
MKPAHFTSNIQKGGALLDDTRRLVEAWDLVMPAAANLTRIAHQNLLGKSSRARADDILLRILCPRFVDPGPDVIATLKQLVAQPREFADACYYEASRDDTLLAAFAEGPLMTWHEAGRIVVNTREVVDWLGLLATKGCIPSWSERVSVKVARGLLAAVRDFRILTGVVRKQFVPAHMTAKGFTYVAFRLHEQGASSRSLLGSPVWRRWLLQPDRVAELFRQADQLGVLRYAEAGTVVRVDWRAGSLQDVVRAAA